jgi:outer membrane protein assembly factor BamB
MRIVTMLFALSFLAACSNAPEKPKPTKLERITPTIELTRVASESLGGRDITGLRPRASELGVAVASADGEVSLLDASALGTIWSEDLGRDIVGGVGMNARALYVTTADGALIALSVADGSLVFEIQLPSVSTTPPEADAENVYVKTQIGRLLAFDATTGEPKWVEETQEVGIGIRGSSPMTLVDGALFVLWESGRLVAYQASTGRIIWERQVAVSRGRSPLERIVDSKGGPSVQNNLVATATRNAQVTVLDARSGQTVWSQDADAYSGAVLAFNLVTVVETDGTVLAFSAQTGESVWSNTDLRYRELSAPTVFANAVAVVDLEGELHLLDPKDGQIVGRIDTGSAKGLVAPVVSADGLLVQLSDGRLTLVGVQR